MRGVIYRVMMRARQSDQWQIWTNYMSYDEAELAAKGLITGGTATEAHIWQVGTDDKRVVARVRSVKKAGWPHGTAAVQKV
jgi:hypothetical protein